MADQQASRQRNLMTKPSSRVQNMSTALLQLNNIGITRDSQKWLLTAAGKIPIQQFYKDKYGWSESTFNNIAWEVQKSALSSFSSADQNRILKFVHGWLPTASQLYKEGTATSQQCKLCHAPREDNFHMFHCTNKEMEGLQEKIQHYLVKDMHDHGDSKFSNILKIGILNAGIYTWIPSMTDISRKWKAAVRDQSRIGWDNLVRGRISTTILQEMSRHYESQNLNTQLYNGTRWAKKLITLIWMTMLELWKARNSIIYNYDTGKTAAMQQEKLEMRIRRCYDQKSLLKAQEQAHWFYSLLANKLQEDAKHAINWLHGVERLIKITRREQQQRPKESVILEQFFQPRISQREEGKQDTENPRAFAQELNPD
jgi:hypothetical protein